MVVVPLPSWVGLHDIHGMPYHEGGHICSDSLSYTERALGDSEMLFPEFLDRLKKLHNGHWQSALLIFYIRGFSADVSRTSLSFDNGEPKFVDQGACWEPPAWHYLERP